MLLKPGMTVLARSLSMRREIQAVLEGRNGCRPEQWLARWKDHRGEHLAHVFRVVTSTKETGIYVRFFGQPADVIHKIDHISGKWAGPIPEPEE